MTPHRENGAKLKKETQCPCTYKNKLILLSSHCENIVVSGPKDSHTQTEASLAFLQTSNGQLQPTYVQPTTDEKGLFTDIEVKTAPPTCGHMISPIYKHLCTASLTFKT